MSLRDDIEAYVHANPDLPKALYQFTVGDETVSVDLTNRRVWSGKAKQKPTDANPDVESTMSVAVYAEFRAARLLLQMAFIDGRLKIKGSQMRFLEFWRLI